LATEDPVKTKEAIDTREWIHNGDSATIDEEVCTTIVKKIKDMILRGGENIYRKIIEWFLCTREKIKEVSIFGIPDEKYGEQVCIWIEIYNKSELTDLEIKEYCREKTTYYTIPTQVKSVSTFPITVSGMIPKIMRRRSMIAE
jgi:fatty-acyl-CoA synthase